MRRACEDGPIAGNIVIGEGERDEAPMLYIGERVGATPLDGSEYPEIDIAVDPLEGTNLCATGAPNSIAVLAACERGGLLHAPDCYMEKIISGPACYGALDTDAPVEDNLKSIAKRLDRAGERPCRDGAGAAAARAVNSGYTHGRRAHPPDRRWGSLCRHRSRRPRRRCSRRNGGLAARPREC